MAKRAFALCESNYTADIAEVADSYVQELILGIIFAESLEKVARILGGELGESEGETIIWFPEEEFQVIWTDGENILILNPKDKITDAMKFVEYRWQRFQPPLIISKIALSVNDRKQCGFAVYEILFLPVENIVPSV